MNAVDRISHHVGDSYERNNVGDNKKMKYVYIPATILVLSIMVIIPVSMSYMIEPKTLAYMMIGGLILGTTVLLIGQAKVDGEYDKNTVERNNLIEDLQHVRVKEELINLFEDNISLIKYKDQEVHINRIMLNKNKEYLDKFIIEIEKQETKDWNYYYCVYKYGYFYRHLKSPEMFKKMNEKLFEPICNSDYNY